MATGPATSLSVDAKRRTTLPSEVLAAAGIQAGTRLVARAEGPGRIVLEAPGRLLAALQAEVAAHKARATAIAEDGDREGGEGERTNAPVELSLVEELFAERAADASLDTPGDELHPSPSTSSGPSFDSAS